MPPEVCAAAILSLCKGVVCFGDTVKKASERTEFSVDESTKKVIFIGTYWKTELCEEQLKQKDCTIEIYRDDGQYSPIEFVQKMADNDEIHVGDEASPGIFYSNMAKTFHRRHKGSAPLEESQNILNGLNYMEEFAGDDSLLAKFRHFFCKNLFFAKLYNYGETITNYQTKAATDHVSKNSVVFNMKSGHKAILSNVVLSVNLTHDVLYKNCTDADVTIVTTHNFKNNEIAVSIRSRVNCVSAVQLIRSLPMESPQHGDGNDKAAGGRIPMTHKLNELF